MAHPRRKQEKEDLKRGKIADYIFSCYEKSVANMETKGFIEFVLLGIFVPTNDDYETWIGNL